MSSISYAASFSCPRSEREIEREIEREKGRVGDEKEKEKS